MGIIHSYFYGTNNKFISVPTVRPKIARAPKRQASGYSTKNSNAFSHCEKHERINQGTLSRDI